MKNTFSITAETRELLSEACTAFVHPSMVATLDSDPTKGVVIYKEKDVKYHVSFWKKEKGVWVIISYGASINFSSLEESSKAIENYDFSD